MTWFLFATGLGLVCLVVVKFVVKDRRTPTYLNVWLGSMK